MSNTPTGPRVELSGAAARVHFGAGRGHADFHYRWLRHWCDRERHPVTRERTLDSSEVADEVFPLEARVERDALRVRWSPDGHESEYPLAWLDAHAYARGRRAAALLRPRGGRALLRGRRGACDGGPRARPGA